MAKQSAGLLLYRRTDGVLEFFLVHPGGPFWKNKDKGAWSIPKGEFVGEPPLEAAKRELKEETGFTARGPFTELNPIVQKGGKWVYAWAAEADFDPDDLQSNTFSLHGREYPEVDRAGWFNEEEALEKILESQSKLITQLLKKLGGGRSIDSPR